MLDIQYIRDNPELVAEKSKQKGYDVDIQQLLGFDKERRKLLRQVEDLRRQRNEQTAQTKGQKPSEEQINQGRELRDQLGDVEHKLESIDKEYRTLLKAVPNMPLDDVPVGASEDENVVAKTVGEKPSFDFQPKTHWEIGSERDWIDKERAAKVTGSRFAYIKGDLVLLQLAIMQFVASELTNQDLIARLIDENKLNLKPTAFIPILPPVMIREDMYDQMDRLEPREDRYHIEGQDDNLWLIGSAEHTLGSMYAGEILASDQLPLRYLGYSNSFRQEAGTYGKDNEGILRLHQFDKLEMEVFSTPEAGSDEHLLLIAIQEYLTQKLGIPYQVLNKCTADIGKPNAHGVDIEAWMPGQDKYRETHTADYMTDYQARRLKTRVKQADGKIELVHTNDATAFALGRIMVAIIENFQTREGKVKIPEPLQAFMGGRAEI
jgi:seryl-tRNA synthetase